MLRDLLISNGNAGLVTYCCKDQLKLRKQTQSVTNNSQHSFRDVTINVTFQQVSLGKHECSKIGGTYTTGKNGKV